MIYSRTLRASTVDLLRHPRTHETLRLAGDWLIAEECGERYPIRQGIPSLVQTKSTPIRHRFWAWVYNRIAFAYDWGVSIAWKWKLGGQPIERLSYLEKIDIQPGSLVLETAVGTGANLRALPNHARYIGLDISFNILRQCQKNLQRWDRAAELIHGDAQFLPFGEGLFDVVYHMGGLQFLTDPQQAFAEALRVVKPGGRIWMIDETYSIPALGRRIPDRVRMPRQSFTHPGRAVDNLPGLVPPPAEDVRAELISNGELYILSFRKKK